MDKATRVCQLAIKVSTVYIFSITTNTGTGFKLVTDCDYFEQRLIIYSCRNISHTRMQLITNISGIVYVNKELSTDRNKKF